MIYTSIPSVWEILVLDSARIAAEVLGRGVVQLDARAHGAVVDQDAAGQGFQVGMLRWNGHVTSQKRNGPDAERRAGFAGWRRFSVD